MNDYADLSFIDAKLIVAKSPLGYAANTYVGCLHDCKYCYAAYMSRWSGHENDKWGSYIDVKHWPELDEKQRKKLDDKSIFICSVTDPYGPQERVHKATRILLEQLVGSGAKPHIVTKSDLVCRDIDLLKELDAEVSLSIETLDLITSKKLSKAPGPDRRIAALEKLHDSGISTSLFIAPILPGITNVLSIIDACKPHVNAVLCETLNLRNKTNQVNTLTWAVKNVPAFAQDYAMIASNTEESREKFSKYLEMLENLLSDYARSNGLQLREFGEVLEGGDLPFIDIGFTHEGYKAAAAKKHD